MTRIKTVRKKGKMKPKEKGKPLSYKKLDKSKATNIKTIKGIFKGWEKAPKYIMRVQSSPHIRMYLNKEGTITMDKKEALQFAHGYDNTSIKAEYWTRQTGIAMKPENI
jgi:hypothetical protein